MGRAGVRLAAERGERVVYAVAGRNPGRDAGELAGIGPLGVHVTNDLAGLPQAGAAVLIDFSTADFFPSVAAMAAQAGVALVSGTTGLDAGGVAALARASERVPVLWEPNMSVGVHVLAGLVREAVLRLGLGYDVEVVETHHRLKVDAPSGTAMRLVEVAREARADGGSDRRDHRHPRTRGGRVRGPRHHGGEPGGDPGADADAAHPFDDRDHRAHAADAGPHAHERRPFAPAARSTAAIEAAMPRQVVETTLRTYCIVSKIASPLVTTPPGELM